MATDTVTQMRHSQKYGRCWRHVKKICLFIEIHLFVEFDAWCCFIIFVIISFSVPYLVSTDVSKAVLDVTYSAYSDMYSAYSDNCKLLLLTVFNKIGSFICYFFT